MGPTEVTAETLLQNLQQALMGAGRGVPGVPSASARDEMRAVERTYGPRATRWGRALDELLAGSYAWNLFEAPPPRRSRLPRVHDLSQCEPLLRVMRDSGELAERERLRHERDAALEALWHKVGRTEEERRLAAQAVQDDYEGAVRRLAEEYRPHYEGLRRATRGDASPLAGPRVRSRPLLLPPLTAALYAACHGDKAALFTSPPEGTPGRRGLEYRQGGNALRLAPDETGPDVGAMLAGLDEMAWDVAMLAVSAFFVRTHGTDPDAAFPFLIDDYFQWRGVDPRKRTRALRAQVGERLALLCSERLRFHGEISLWLADPCTGRRVKTPVVTDGPFLVSHARLSRRPDVDADAGDGHLLSLGEWARPFIEERAMRGVFLKRLAEYDLQRQEWERRIGWYLTFQMNNQGARMRFEDVTQGGKQRTVVTPQHPLRMRTVLANSHVPWEEMARTNPGKVIRQWMDALETLRRDGVLGPARCLDGDADGADLPARGRLAAMLERRYEFVPGRDLLPHLRAKRGDSSPRVR